MSTSLALRVTVVIPTYNSGATAVEAVHSALGQTYPPREVIVVDDGSTDNTQLQIASFAGRVRYVRQANAGVAAARNRALSMAEFEWVAFLDSDDVWHPQKLELQARALESRRHVVLLAARIFAWPGVMPAAEAAEPQDVPFERLLLGNLFPTSTVLAKAAALRQVGGFDPKLRGPEDWDLWLRLARIAPVAYLPVPLAGYRSERANSLSKNARQMETGLQHILEKQRSLGTFVERPVLLAKAQAYILYSTALMYRDSGETWSAAIRLAKSLLTWPLDLPSTNGTAAVRAKMLAATLFPWHPRHSGTPH